MSVSEEDFEAHMRAVGYVQMQEGPMRGAWYKPLPPGAVEDEAPGLEGA